jgi:intermediate cleaving peptidase 55
MRRAGRASGRAFTTTMSHAHTFPSEFHLDAHLSHQLLAQGCTGSAFEPVVAGATNALSIHYVRNDALLDPEKLVLVDGGGEYGHYASDITRTFPVSGKFSPAQKDLYSAVLSVQRDCIALCRESSKLSLDGLHSIAESSLKANLKSLGFDMSNGGIDELFPHHLTHYIGLDVHDCPGYSRKEELRGNMCVTIEPGIYVPDDERWPKAFRGLGIRIEDSVVVGSGEGPPTVLTTEAVKEVVDIEALRN